MNGRIAKKIRKAVYGDTVSGLKGRKYYIDGRKIVADKIRQMYQKIKRDYTRRVEDAEDKGQAEKENQNGNRGAGPALAS